MLPGAGRAAVHRAWPGTGSTVLLELRRGRDVVGARWWPDERQAHEAARRYAGTSAVLVGQALVHTGGADRRLPHLAADLAAPGARLVGHRPERRAVVARTDGTWVKHVRTGRGSLVADGLARAGAALAGVARVPRVLGDEKTADVVVLEGLSGRTLLELTADPRTTDVELTAAWRAAGAVSAALAAAPTDGLPHWTLADEVAATARWVTPDWPAAGGGHAAYDVARRALEVTAGRAAALPDLPAVPTHRDLHDQQVLWDGQAAALLDCDTLAAADPALDPANVLVHLRLRVLQGLVSAGRGDAAARAYLAGLGPDARTTHRLAVLETLTCLRLAGLYAWRPRWSAVAPALLAGLSPSARPS